MQMVSSNLLGEEILPTSFPPPGRKQLVKVTSNQGEAPGEALAQNAG